MRGSPPSVTTQNEDEEESIWTITSLDAVLVAFWTLIVAGSILSIVLDVYVSNKWLKELLAQLSVVLFILLSAYRAGVNTKVDALTWYTSFYVTFLLYSWTMLNMQLTASVLIQHVFYAMMAFVCLLGAVKIYRHFILNSNKKKKKKRN